MGIREEIEKTIKEIRDKGPALEDWEHHKRYADEVVGVHDGTIHGLGLALSILDEHLGECVTEHSIGNVGPDIHRIALADNGDFVRDFVLRPGDHISIYVRGAR